MSKTIRMNGARKIELKLNMAAAGYREVTMAIADGFTQAHKDVKNSFTINGKPHSQKVSKNGLYMNSYGVGNNRVPNITYALAWSKEYLAQRAAEPKSHSNYLGNAGTAHLENPQIKDDLATSMWGGKDGFAPATKYKYAWQPYVGEGLIRFLRMRVTGALTQSKGPMGHRNGHIIMQNIQQIDRALAYLKMDEALRHTEATQLVSKRANPYEDSQYVIRTGASYSNNDYSNYELLKLPNSSTRLVISKMQKVLPLLRNLHAAVVQSVRAGQDSTFNANQLKNHRQSLASYESQLQTRIDLAVTEWDSLEAAIKMDLQQRKEVVEYLKALPHKHLLDMSRNAAVTWFGNETQNTTIEPSPQFTLGHGLAADIKAREETIERTKATIRAYEAKVAADTSNLNDLKMQVALGELKQFATVEGWIKPDITGGEEE